MSNTKLFRLTGQRPMVVPSPGADWILGNQFIGVEIEIEDYSRRQVNNLLDTSNLWVEKEDNSLRSGTELVLADPLMGNDLRTALSSFFSTVTSYSTGPRTSVHVHMNMRQEEDTLEVLRNLCMLYYIYEDAFFQMSDPNRKWCSYCHPFEECPPEPLIEILRGQTLDSVSDSFERTASNTARYYGLNLYALTRYGTVEFRHMPGTRSEERVLEWINFLMELKKAATGLAQQGMTPASVFFNIEDMHKIAELMPVFGERMRSYVPDVVAYRRLGLASAYLANNQVPYRNYRVNNSLRGFMEKQLAKIPEGKPAKVAKPKISKAAAMQDVEEYVARAQAEMAAALPSIRLSTSTTRSTTSGAVRVAEWGVNPYSQAQAIARANRNPGAPANAAPDRPDSDEEY